MFFVCMYFDNFTYSDGTEFELRVDDVVIVVVVVDFLPHLDLFFSFGCFDFKVF